MTEDNTNELKGLILELLDSNISQERRMKLQDLLNSDSEACKYYAEYVMLCAALKQYGSSTALAALEDSKANFDYNLLADLADLEESAPTASIEKPAEILEVDKPKDKLPKKNSLKIFLAYVSVAAVFFLVVTLNNMYKANPVAIIDDSINAEWSNIDLSTGYTIFDSDGFLKLETGVVKLQYPKATVILEGPSEFACKNSMQIDMLSGSVYVIMEEGQKGFVVDTPVSRIVDLGTEFGVQIGNGNSTEVHVLKGKAAVSTSNNPQESQTLPAGTAGSVNSTGSGITDIELDKYKFVREIDSNTNLISRGRTHIDMSSITSGRDGRLQAISDYWLDPVIGKTENALKTKSIDKDFLPIEFNKFIDGIFVPKGIGNQVVSTKGTVFADCPATCGDYYANFSVNPDPDSIEITDTRSGKILFNDIIYGTNDNPCLLMHSNMGITYDLEAIRQEYPYRKIVRFTANVGIADLDEPYPCNADIWVLIDGEVRYSLKTVKEKGQLFDVSVELNENDRFLTLAATDGGDIDIMKTYERAITCDWCVFTCPALELR